MTEYSEISGVGFEVEVGVVEMRIRQVLNVDVDLARLVVAGSPLEMEVVSGVWDDKKSAVVNADCEIQRRRKRRAKMVECFP